MAHLMSVGGEVVPQLPTQKPRRILALEAMTSEAILQLKRSLVCELCARMDGGADSHYLPPSLSQTP